MADPFRALQQPVFITPRALAGSKELDLKIFVRVGYF
jgi:hypothetical protein